MLARGEAEDCLQLLRLCGRLGVEEAREKLAGIPARALLAAWGAAPGERGLAELLLPLLGWESVPREEREPGSWWAEAGRLGEDGDHFYDRETGLPLYARVARTGALLARVPAGSLTPAHAREVKLDGVGDAEVRAGFWMGVHEVTVREYLTIRGAEAIQENIYSRDETLPMRRLSWLDATRFCRELDDFDGGPVPVIYRLPRVLEWELALEFGGQWGRQPRPEEARLRFDETPLEVAPPGGRAPNTLGIEDLVGNVGELALERSGSDYRRPRSWTCDQPELPDEVVCDLEDLHHVMDFLFHPRGDTHPYPSNYDRIREQFGGDAAEAFRRILTRAPQVPVLGASFANRARYLDSWLREFSSVGTCTYDTGFRLVAAPASCLDCEVHG